MAGHMKPIGDYATLFGQVDFGSYLEGDPPAVLLQYAATGSFRPIHGDDPGETLFRSADSGFDAEEGSGGSAAPLPIEVAYMVFPLRSPERPDEMRLLVGCADECDIRINDKSISRQHAWIERRGDEYWVKDNESTIATYINGQRIEPGTEHKLGPSDQLTLGTVDLIFLDAAGFFHFVRTLFGTR